MDGFVLTIWLVRIAFLVALYLVLLAVARVLLRDLRTAASERMALGRLVVVASPRGEPAAGSSFDLDAVTTLGRDVNNTIVIEDPFASSEHASLTFRGRSWFIEDLRSTNGTYVNGSRVDGVSAIGFGDELQIGEVRLRLDRGRP